MITTVKLITDDGRRIRVYALPSRLATTLLEQATLAAQVHPVHEGWSVETVDGTDTYPHGDAGHALRHALGIRYHRRDATPPAADAPAAGVCGWCGLPPDQCPDPAGHDRADRASENSWRRRAAQPAGWSS